MESRTYSNTSILIVIFSSQLSSNIEERYAQLKEILSKKETEDIEELKNFIEQNPHAEQTANHTYLEGKLNMCDDCSNVYITFKGYHKNEKGRYVYDKAMDSKLDISKSIVRQLVQIIQGQHRHNCKR